VTSLANRMLVAQSSAIRSIRLQDLSVLFIITLGLFAWHSIVLIVGSQSKIDRLVSRFLVLNVVQQTIET